MSKRLNKLQAETRAAGEEMAQQRGRFVALANRHEDGTAPVAVSAFNLFQTPPTLAARMAEMLPANAGRVLEPSAGLGRIVRAVADARPAAAITMIEQSAECCSVLYQTCPAAKLYQRDFLEFDNSLVPFDAVIMNPPFKMGRDVKHIKHALNIVKPGGLVIALCYDGVKQNKHLKPISDTWETLPPDTFKSEGTRAGVVLLTITK